MMGSQFYFRDKIPVGILGATGCVGQKFVQLLSQHSWFEITAIAASERSAGKMYKDAVNWLLETPIPESIASMKVLPCRPDLPCSILFSGLDADVAGEIETSFADSGYLVVSNARNHRMQPDVPLLIADVNGEHLELLKRQKFPKGKLLTNPNCSVAGIATVLKPLNDVFGLESVHVATMQAISGAGYPGAPSLEILDNVIPFIRGEEEKLETEPLKILGAYREGTVFPANFKISAHCNRVPVTDGHLANVSVKFKTKPSKEAILEAWKNFKTEAQDLQLPFACTPPIVYFEEESYPQPKLHRHLGKGMAVSVGRLRECPLFDYKFTILTHNTVRGAAGCAILNAEYLVRKGYVIW